MIFHPDPREKESTAWAGVLAWVAFIYLTIPLARRIQEVVRDRAGKAPFLWVTFLAFGVAAIWIVRALLRKQWTARPAQVAVLVGVGALFCWLTWSLRDIPEEAFHFVQYGVLSLLLFRALRHRLQDLSIYLAATLAGAAFGILDELIQWVVPLRYFDYRDIWINVQAVGLVQIALVAGIRPGGVGGRPSRTGIQLVCRFAIVTLLLLLVCVSSTPRTVEWVARYLPAAIVFDHIPSEYGFRIEDPDIGVFFSRLPAEELLRQDRERGTEAAQRINRIRADDQYRAFLRELPAHRDPLAVEARIHLFRRDRYMAEAKKREESGDFHWHAHVAWRENQILETYFSHTLQHSRFGWSPERRERMLARAQPLGPYQSAVSQHLITRLTQARATALLLILMLAAIAGDRWEAREKVK